MSLSAFLHPVQKENQKVVVSDRFLEADGTPAPFVIRPVTQAENAELMKKFRKLDKNGNEVFNRVEYNHALVALAVVEPDLDNAELQKAYGVLGKEKLLKEMLYVGEFTTLMEKIYQLSGLDADINDDIDDAKN